jgi:hypothetical protein
MIGQSIPHYIMELGASRTGEVYRAEDSNLHLWTWFRFQPMSEAV